MAPFVGLARAGVMTCGVSKEGEMKRRRTERGRAPRRFFRKVERSRRPGSFFFLDGPDFFTRPSKNLHFFLLTPKQTKPLLKNSARRLRSPLHRGHGRRLDGHRDGAGRGQGPEQQGLDFDVFVQKRSVGVCLAEEDGHHDARRGAARALPFAERRSVGLDRHLELPGEEF